MPEPGSVPSTNRNRAPAVKGPSAFSALRPKTKLFFIVRHMRHKPHRLRCKGHEVHAHTHVQLSHLLPPNFHLCRWDSVSPRSPLRLPDLLGLTFPSCKRWYIDIALSMPQGYLPISTFLVTPAKSLLSCKVRYPHALEMRAWTFLAGAGWHFPPVVSRNVCQDGRHKHHCVAVCSI